MFRKAEALGCTVLHHTQNLGKGAALKTGFLYLVPDEAWGVVCADSDGLHRVEDIIRVAEAIGNKAEMVLGTREFTGEVPFRSRFGNRTSS